MNTKIAEALLELNPEAKWSVSNSGSVSDIEWITDGVRPTDSEIETKRLELVNGENLRLLRLERNNKLAQSDWVVVKEREEGGSVSNFAAWKTYRQSLRDITNTYSDLDTVVWPTEPS